MEMAHEDHLEGKFAIDGASNKALAPRRSPWQKLTGIATWMLIRVLRGEKRPPSILRNNTNLPVFLAIALLITLVCNFALRENTAQASRYLGPAASIRQVQALLARDPDNAELHSQLGELYVQQHNYRRAMFHLREASRLAELYGE